MFCCIIKLWIPLEATSLISTENQCYCSIKRWCLIIGRVTVPLAEPASNGMDKQKLASLLLRVGLAFVFAYAAISALVLPDVWIGFYPEFIRNILPEQLLLYSHSALEILLALWLLSGKKTFYAALFAGIWILSIILGTLDAFLITFRDVSIFFSAVALAILTKNPE